MRLFPFALMAFSAIASLMAGERNVMSVEDVIARHDDFNGKLIQVQGWLTLCEPRSCWISSGPNKKSPYLSIGSSATFDRMAAGRVGTIVVVKAILDTRCLHSRVDATGADDEMVICFDRAEELQNPKLILN